jgi:DNA polymerase-1
VDYFSLIGDKIDNVQGVPGVGEKTAVKLLIAGGTLEGVFASLDDSPLSTKLKAHRDLVFRNRDLVRLKTDVPLSFKATDLAVGKPDPARFPDLLKRLEFRGPLFGVEEAQARPELNVNSARQVITVLDEATLARLGRELASSKRFAYDLETDGLNSRTCGTVGLSFATQPGTGWYVPVGHTGGPKQLSWAEVEKVVKPIFQNPSISKCGQNLKFDNMVLACLGISVAGELFDTMIAAYCLEPSRTSFGLKDLAADLLQERMVRIEELLGKSKDADFAAVPVEQAAPYAAADAEVSLRLTEIFSERLDKTGLMSLFRGLEMPLVEIIRKMEHAGVAVDRAYLRDVGARFEAQRAQLEKDIYECAGEEFTLNSPKQLGRILFEKLKLPPGKKTKTGFSTDEEVLRKLAAEHPICEKIIAHREMAKLSSTYVDALLALADDHGRIHTTFHQTGTITGRLSSSNPNLQNIPIRSENGRLIRRAFVAPEGSVLVSADYSQIDLRALAHISGDPVLIKTFLAGGDIHASTAAEIFHVAPSAVSSEMRRSAKAINFGIVYGQSAFALAQSLSIPMEQAKEFITKYFERYAGVRTWIDATLAEARKTGVVATLAGRRRNIDDINSPNAFTRGFAERAAMNTPIQGTSADIIKQAMIHVDRDLEKSGLATRMLLQVHDELVFEVPKSELDRVLPLIRRAMESAYRLKVPLVVDMKMGVNWNDMERVVLERVA